MKTLTKFCVIACFSAALQGTAAAQTALSQHAEYAAIDQTMQTMMLAFEQGKAETAHQVILKDTAVVGYSRKQQKVLNISGDEWTKGFEPASDEELRHRQYHILDITDTGALVKVTLDYPEWQGVDYLALIKIDGRWRIVSKSWSGKVKPAK